MPDPSSPTPPRRRGLILLLGAAVVLFLISLPWQMRQWAETARLNEEARVSEGRIQQLHKQKSAAPAPSPDSLSAKIQAIAARAQSADDPAAVASVAAEIATLESEAARSSQVADTLADLYQTIGYMDRAVAMARLSRRLAPNAPGPLLRLGYLEIALGRLKSGSAYYRQAIERAPGMAEPHVALALAHELSGDLRSTEAELRIARRLQPSNWRTALLLSQNLTAQRRSPEAQAALAEALRLAPDEPLLAIAQARLSLDRAENQSRGEDAIADIATARNAVERALLLDPNNLDARFLLGRIHLKSGAEPEARKEWEAVFAVRPTYPKLRTNLGRLLIRTGDKVRGETMLQEEAREATGASEFNRLVVTAGNSPENMALRRELARWCMTAGKLSRAILEWQEILSRLPEDREAKEQLQIARARRGDA